MKRVTVFILVLALASLSAAADNAHSAPTATSAAANSPPVMKPENAFPGPSPVSAANLPPAPDAAPLAPAAFIIRPQPEAMGHKFLDVKNAAAFAAVAAGLTGDALSTQKGLGRPGFYEVNPIARPFVQNRPGAALYGAASFAVVAGGMYLAHKKNHHHLERILPFAMGAWEGFLTFRNYHLISGPNTQP